MILATANEPYTGWVSMFLFDQATQKWNQLGKRLLGDHEGDRFGISLGMSRTGNVVAVGASNHGTDTQGMVQVFEGERQL